MEKEIWINEILISAERIKKVVPDDLLFSKIQNRLHSETKLSTQWIWLVAASFAVLITINAVLLFATNSKAKDGSQAIAATILKSNQLY